MTTRRGFFTLLAGLFVGAKAAAKEKPIPKARYRPTMPVDMGVYRFAYLGPKVSFRQSREVHGQVNRWLTHWPDGVVTFVERKP